MDDRTMIAAMALQGLLAGDGIPAKAERFVAMAVEFADDLLACLAETAPPVEPPSPAFEKISKGLAEAAAVARGENTGATIHHGRAERPAPLPKIGED